MRNLEDLQHDIYKQYKIERYSDIFNILGGYLELNEKRLKEIMMEYQLSRTDNKGVSFEDFENYYFSSWEAFPIVTKVLEETQESDNIVFSIQEVETVKGSYLLVDLYDTTL